MVCVNRQLVAKQSQSTHLRDRKNQQFSISRRLIFVGLGSLYVKGAQAQIPCPGLRGYALKTCLREQRKNSGDDSEDVQGTILRNRQYEQPGELVTLPSGIQYRELLEGNGPEAVFGSPCEISYTVYRLSSGAYFKYSSGGTPVYMFSLGYGNEGKDDVGSTYSFILGEMNAVPAAVSVALQGMRQGGKRRILIPPQFGWADSSIKIRLQPDTFGGGRRLAGHKDEPLLFEVDLVKVFSSVQELDLSEKNDYKVDMKSPFRLPAPPLPSRSNK